MLREPDPPVAFEFPVPEDSLLLVSAFARPGAISSEGEGLWVLDGQTAVRIDDDSSAGLSFDGMTLARGLRNRDRAAMPSTLVLHGQTSPEARSNPARDYQSVPGASNLHDVLWDGDLLMVVSTAQNKVLWWDPRPQTIVREWKPGSEPDSWHLNSLYRSDTGTVFVSGFGQNDKVQGWREQILEGSTPTGFVMELETEEIVLAGLRTPHNPRWSSGRWVVCESVDRQISVYGDDGLDAQIPLPGWTRGLEITDDFYLVGTSARIMPDENVEPSDSGHLVAVSRDSLDVVADAAFPSFHIYDLLLIPRYVTWLG